MSVTSKNQCNLLLSFSQRVVTLSQLVFSNKDACIWAQTNSIAYHCYLHTFRNAECAMLHGFGAAYLHLA